MTEPTCQEMIYDGSRDVVGRRCGRKVKDQGLCGIHLGAKLRTERNDAARRQNRETQQQVRADTQVICDQLAQHGFQAEPYFVRTPGGFGGRYTGGVVLSAESTKDLLSLLEGLGSQL